jgi:lipid-A-disaccharide synthase
MTKKILIITGEASGDLHAANLVHDILKQNPTIQFVGMGGQKMREAGVKIIQDINQLSVIGLTQILARLPFLYSIYKKIKQHIQQNPYDLIILVDCPGYNLRFAKIAKQAKQKVFYYISPQLWAWHQSRVKLIQKYVDTMAVVFPFEVDFYKKFNIDAKFVGHPLSATVKPTLSINEAKKLFDLTDAPIIGLMPGSRRSEIKRMLPIMLDTVKLLKKQFPLLQFIMPLASSLTQKDIDPYLQNVPFTIKVISGKAYDVINVSDTLLVTSGTATLETTLLSKPFVLIYKDSFLTYLIAKMVIKVPFFGLCNLLAGKAIIKEFLQYDAKPEAIAEETTRFLSNSSYRKEVIANLESIKERLKTENIINPAALVLEQLRICHFNFK